MQILMANAEDHLNEMLLLSPWLALPSSTLRMIGGNLALLEEPATLRQVSLFEKTHGPLIEAALLEISSNLEPAAQSEMEQLEMLSGPPARSGRAGGPADGRVGGSRAAER